MKIEERNQIFELVLSEMATRFTSSQFCTLAKQLGVPEENIAQGYAASFLHKRVHKVEGKRSWIKTDSFLQKKAKEMAFSGKTYREISAKTGMGMGRINLIKKSNFNKLNEAKCIEYLKSKGYKVLKPKWEEL